jgi:hypothetical protein
LQNFESAFVLWRAKDRQQDYFVRDIKIRITCGKASAFFIHARRHRQRQNIKRRPIFGLHPFEQGEVSLQRFEVRILRIFLNCGQYGRAVDESTDVVYVPVGVVAFDSVTQP